MSEKTIPTLEKKDFFQKNMKKNDFLAKKTEHSLDIFTLKMYLAYRVFM